MLRDILPKASVIAMLANPLSPDAIPEIGSVQAGAHSEGDLNLARCARVKHRQLQAQ
jgi:hypothetical protein